MSPSLEQFKDAELDLSALVSAAGSILSGVPAAPADGRVSAHPDARTVRYYQTLGLVQNPLRYEGRRAVYGYGHLLQLVAVKLLQAHGLSLAQVQRVLAGATHAQLEAAVNERLTDLPRASSAEMHARVYHPTFVEHPAKPSASQPEPSAGRPASDRRSLIATEVAPGVVVTIDPSRVTDPPAVLDRISRILETLHGGDE